ncbi:hypothetical protein HYH02_013416 [Chlamydomonas schloesseri]|uniref:Protein kinase domain-containing protein n=1 Tax=Chlamydomonas schloesseri TaxID=2026947 RepID=A0A835T3S5_9CHLO|nr:hypothetical protein HYH02_013416 [Chlamydomonas schloesseri]|eukprot:KAG2431285.1 hypothetical protein HYH02_013416 [Chlamydomonas schloesseri]
MEASEFGSAPPQAPRSKVEFVDLCGTLEDLCYLGEGSNGVVYSASWHGARVAVKFLLGNNDDSTHLQRCFTEAVLTRVLSHPCVVQCFATAIAQLTTEVWDGIQVRTQRHQSLLQSSSLGRATSTAAAPPPPQDAAEAEALAAELAACHDRTEAAILADLKSGLRGRSTTGGGISSAGLQPSGSRLSSALHNQMSGVVAPLPRLATPPPSMPMRPGSSQHQHQQLSPLRRSLEVARSPSQVALLLSGVGGMGTPAAAPATPAGAGGGLAAALLSGPSPLPKCGSVGGGARSSSNCDGELPPRTSVATADSDGAAAVSSEGTSSGAAAAATAAAVPARRTSFEVPPSLATAPTAAPAAGPGAGEDCQAARPQPGEGVSLMQALVDLHAEPGRHCTVVVMEYMDGGTLHHAIVRSEFSARRSLEHRTKLLALLLTAQELAQGMAHLHGLDILHGDLKPTNVLLKGSPCQFAPAGAAGANGFTCIDPRGYTSKIADLGLARPCIGETAELTSDQWGALAYLAPEAAKGSCCKASDVYSFGVMLWEMSAGVRPYLGLTTPQVLMGLVTGTLQLTWPSDGSIYAPLRSLGIACTDPNPAERPTFEVAARILGRMVRHIRSASEPLRQRHSSAMSMETGGGCGSAGAHSPAGCCGTGGGKPSCGGGAVLNHAPRSMPMYIPPPGAAAGSRPTTGSGLMPRPKPMSQAEATAAGMLSGPGGYPITAMPLPVPMPALGPAGNGNAVSSAAVAAARLSTSGAAVQQPLPGPWRGASGAAQQQQQPQGGAAVAAAAAYPRARLGGNGGYCGGAVLRSPLGGTVSFRLAPTQDKVAPLGGGAVSATAVTGAGAADGAPLEPHAGGGGGVGVGGSAQSLQVRRPGSSPAHTRVEGSDGQLYLQPGSPPPQLR